ncbi:cobalt-precorrin 3 C17-methyltransferase [Desulfoscipio gibsoniae DSM 7213]|uniref:Cobalt-precorrin 3 C17-methyltransferase n=1 Tax=Desulfoscipio gibsoniae DSM 7213 TaxID=767817 RepID=R4KFT0_9FIRM|nr:cobalt-precorrin 3 C17-methyltransferase [Desulfoscipio gibsoniae DSM 7213]
MQSADVIVGYKTYIDLIQDIIQEKQVISTAMTREKERCEAAIEQAAAGYRVAVVSSGDPGVYGMAGLILELLESTGQLKTIPVQIIPGITSATASAARLGAPLMHDFAVISLSDLLTPWETIEKRLEAAAMADFVIVLYNPASKKRDWQIKKAREICLQHKTPTTPVGIVKNAAREDEEIYITDLSGMLDYPIDMLTTVIVGNCSTRRIGEFIITPRGYAL